MTQNSKSARCQLWWGAIFLSLSILILASGCSTVGYVAKQGTYQLEMLAGREKIIQVLQRPGLPPEYYRKMALIMDARRFARDHLSLTPGEVYSTVNLNWHRTLFNVSAVQPYRFIAYKWHFPIVGLVPYMGYFDLSDAIEEAKRLQGLGYDVLERRAGAYSTLGYFNDPVWPSMLRYPDFLLVELVFHELAHAKLFFKGSVEFNENFATFVGRVGLLQFLRHRYGDNNPHTQEALEYFEDEVTQNNWMRDLYEKLDDLYKSKLSAKQKKYNKGKIIWRAIKAYHQLDFETAYFGGNTWKGLNNARIMSFKRYNFEQKALAESFKQAGYNWAAWFEMLRKEGPGGLARQAS